MPTYSVRPNARSYGHAVGVILLDCVQPNIPGDTANASSFPYPVLFKDVPGLTTKAAKSGDPALVEDVVAAAKWLEQHGVRAISSNCGFLLYHQAAIAAAVDIPVAMSSLSQLALLDRLLPPGAEIGVLTADAALLGEDLLSLSGHAPTRKLRIRGLADAPEFRSAMRNQSGTLDSDRLEAELVEEAQGIVRDHPAVRAILLECAVFTPYRAAIIAATGVPVLDFLTLIDWLHGASFPRPTGTVY